MLLLMDEIFDRPHPHPDASLQLRDRIGWIIFAWDALVPGPRGKEYYLAMADDILKETERTS
jgi:hypothetical protein